MHESPLEPQLPFEHLLTIIEQWEGVLVDGSQPQPETELVHPEFVEPQPHPAEPFKHGSLLRGLIPEPLIPPRISSASSSEISSLVSFTSFFISNMNLKSY